MLMAQTDGIELLPDTNEAVWAAVASSMLLVLALLLVVLVVLAVRSVQQRRRLESRVERLEEIVLRADSPST